MAFDADGIVARRRLRRRLALWRLLAIVAGVVLVIGGLAVATGNNPFAARDHVLRVTLSGIVFDDPVLLDGLAEAAADPATQAVLIVIDSPGGTTTGGEAIYREVRRLVDNEIPVVAVIRTVGASAGYLVAMATDRIYALETSITGSIGVLLETAEISGLLERLGIESESFASGPLKGQPSPLRPLTDDARTATQALIDDIHAWFFEIFVERRGLEVAAARELADGRAYSGRQALELNLIDAIGGEREARRWLSEVRGVPPETPTVDLDLEDEPGGFFDLITGLTKKTLFAERLRLDGLISVWHAGQN